VQGGIIKLHAMLNRARRNLAAGVVATGGLLLGCISLGKL
jgi:hypothetical protein